MKYKKRTDKWLDVLVGLVLIDAHTVLGRVGRHCNRAKFVGRLQDALGVRSGSITVSATRDQHANVRVQGQAAGTRRLESTNKDNVFNKNFQNCI